MLERGYDWAIVGTILLGELFRLELPPNQREAKALPSEILLISGFSLLNNLNAQDRRIH